MRCALCCDAYGSTCGSLAAFYRLLQPPTTSYSMNYERTRACLSLPLFPLTPKDAIPSLPLNLALLNERKVLSYRYYYILSLPLNLALLNERKVGKFNFCIPCKLFETCPFSAKGDREDLACYSLLIHVYTSFLPFFLSFLPVQ